MSEIVPDRDVVTTDC